MTIRVVAVDDEPLALRGIEHVLRDLDDVLLVGTAQTAREAKSLVARARPDVALLDIRMRDGDGLELARNLAGPDGPAIVFVTAFDRYATRAFELAAADYVLKPAEPARLRLAIDKAKARLAERQSADRIEELKQIIAAMREQDEFRNDRNSEEIELWVRSHGGNLVRIRPDQIVSVEAEGDYVRIQAGGRSFLHRTSIVALARVLDTRDFVRVHRSTLVRFDQIVEVHRSSFGLHSITLLDGRQLKVGRVHAKELKRRLEGME